MGVAMGWEAARRLCEWVGSGSEGRTDTGALGPPRLGPGAPTALGVGGDPFSAGGAAAGVG